MAEQKMKENRRAKYNLMDAIKFALDFLRGFLLILFFLSLGKMISALLPIVFPGSIIGLVLLFIALSTSIVKKEWIMCSGSFIIKYMPLLFIPISVGVLNYFELIVNNWLVIIFSIVFTTLLMLLLVGHFFQFINKKEGS